MSFKNLNKVTIHQNNSYQRPNCDHAGSKRALDSSVIPPNVSSRDIKPSRDLATPQRDLATSRDMVTSHDTALASALLQQQQILRQQFLLAHYQQLSALQNPLVHQILQPQVHKF